MERKGCPTEEKSSGRSLSPKEVVGVLGAVLAIILSVCNFLDFIPRAADKEKVHFVVVTDQRDQADQNPKPIKRNHALPMVHMQAIECWWKKMLVGANKSLAAVLDSFQKHGQGERKIRQLVEAQNQKLEEELANKQDIVNRLKQDNDKLLRELRQLRDEKKKRLQRIHQLRVGRRPNPLLFELVDNDGLIAWPGVLNKHQIKLKLKRSLPQFVIGVLDDGNADAVAYRGLMCALWGARDEITARYRERKLDVPSYLLADEFLLDLLSSVHALNKIR